MSTEHDTSTEPPPRGHGPGRATVPLQPPRASWTTTQRTGQTARPPPLSPTIAKMFEPFAEVMKFPIIPMVSVYVLAAFVITRHETLSVEVAIFGRTRITAPFEVFRVAPF